MKSNVMFVSNVYRWGYGISAHHDPDYVRNCLNYKQLCKITDSNITLSDLQTRFVKCVSSCRAVQFRKLQKQHRQLKDWDERHYDFPTPFGFVQRNGTLKLICRCEDESCENFSKCMPNPIVRELNKTIAENENTENDIKYEWLDTIAEEQIFAEPEGDFEETEEAIPEEYTVAPTVIAGEFVELADSTAIITADIDSHILVNAGAGTGKTHTVIERLAHIIDSSDVDLGQVLVLCYTNAARDVIIQRLTEKGMGESARQLVICTLDSLAWQNLSSGFEGNSEISSLFALGYDGCIKKFNREFDADDWSGFEYVIVDEVQDLVNERAKMLLKILSALECGYLLLGDKCQAIYDYDCGCENSMTSVEFYESLNAILPSSVIKYELIGNKRQMGDLAIRTAGLRRALLEFPPNEVITYFNAQINVMTHMDFLPIIFSRLSETETYAVLTRNNGQAEWISAELHKKDIPHNLLRTVTPQVSLNRWIADMFWDYREPRITKEDFIERYTIRVKNNVQLAEKFYNAIVETIDDENENDYFELMQFLKSLKKGSYISPLLLNTPCETLTVSTIHKAKGREFDHVYLFNDNVDDILECRVRYVGETRPKTKLSSLKSKNWCLQKSKATNSRWMNYGFHKWSTYCSKIVIGLRGDINLCGFIEGDLEQAVQRQFYISRNISINDKVDIYLSGDTYQVYHNAFCIGALSDEAKTDLLNSIKSRYSWSSIPPYLSEIYVNNIISVIPYSFTSNVDPMFKDSQFWLGVELTGFAKANWNTRGEVV